MKPLTIEQLKALEVGDWVWVVFQNNVGFSTYRQKTENNDKSFCNIKATLLQIF